MPTSLTRQLCATKKPGPAHSDDYAGLSRLGLEDFYVEQ